MVKTGGDMSQNFKSFAYKIKNQVQNFALIMAASVLVVGCATTDLTEKYGIVKTETMTPEQKTKFNSMGPTARTHIVYEEDVFNVGDTAEVTVHGFEDFSGIYSVDRSGKTHFTHVGQVQVAGVTITDLQTTLRQRYGACCLQNPSVSVRKEAQKLGSIVVDGAVDEPGAFEINRIIKLSEAVALAGGVTLDGDRTTVVLARQVGNERRLASVNLEEVQLGAYDPPIYPNDVIFVQDNAGRLMFNDFIRTVPIVNAVIYAVTRANSN